MAEPVIPENIRLFILNRIDSVAQLEGLLLLRSKPDYEWSVPEVAQRLYVREADAAGILARLCTDGFLLMRGGAATAYQYSPASSELKALVDRVAETYAKHLVSVTNLIHGKPRKRVQEFADAFRLREEK
jgi:hypothetical protein